MDRKLGFIGCGNMGGAILKGVLRTGALEPNMISVYVKTDKSKEKYGAMGVNVAESIKELCMSSDVIVLAVKPIVAAEVLAEAEPCLNNKALVSIAAGITVEKLKKMSGGARILRTMPNTPALVGEGAMIMCTETDITDEEKDFAVKVFGATGSIFWVAERLMDAASTVGGCTPAFVAMFIEALSDGGVKEGLPRALSYELAANAVYGSAKMIAYENMHPGVLKDMVCSPGGTTIEGVEALEEGRFRFTVMDCVSRATEKSKRLIK